MRTKDESLFALIVDYVNDYFEKYGRSPSTREIEKGTQISRPTVQRYLKNMQERGEVEYDGHRGIVTQYMREMMDTGRVGMGNSIPCGPMDEVADAELEHIRLPIALTGRGEFFLLRARGMSMINAGIDDGDLVLIRKQHTAKPGDIIAFLYDNSLTTLKRYDPEDGVTYLVPENDAMQPIEIRGTKREKLMIQGVATMVIKEL